MHTAGRNDAAAILKDVIKTVYVQEWSKAINRSYLFFKKKAISLFLQGLSVH